MLKDAFSATRADFGRCSSRRRFLQKTSCLLLGGGSFCSKAFADNTASSGATTKAPGKAAAVGQSVQHKRLIDNVKKCVVISRRDAKENWGWFHPYVCMVPTAAGPVWLMTLQTRAGTDYYGPLHFSISKDLGNNWTKPEPVPGMEYRPVGEGLRMGFCDIVPQYHPQTDTVLALGHNVYYSKDGKDLKPPRERDPGKPVYWPVYIVRDAAGKWSTPQKLVWDDPRALPSYVCGCSQWTILPNGDVLIPFFSNKIVVVSASFDGKNVRIRRVGNVLAQESNSDLAEPSLAMLDGRHYLTIRAHDGRGYMTTSPDGLNWEPIRPWVWEDGTPLDMFNTQQHWLTHSEGLFLVYNRKMPINEKVRRWRAPLLAAMVNRKTMRLMRDTEITVLPIVGDGVNDPNEVALMGNFNVTNASPEESWVTVGENLGYYRDGEYHRIRNWVMNWRGDLLMARIRWTRKNNLVSSD